MRARVRLFETLPRGITKLAFSGGYFACPILWSAESTNGNDARLYPLGRDCSELRPSESTVVEVRFLSAEANKGLRIGQRFYIWTAGIIGDGGILDIG